MDTRIIIFDTTLRDGEQSPGASLSVSEKVEIAQQLQRLGVDVIEAGFPVSSPRQYEAVQRIAAGVDTTIAALARANEKDIKIAFDALKEAPKKRIHTFSSTSDFQIRGKFSADRYGATLKDKRDYVLKMSHDAVQYARSLCDDVEFSAEDAGRTDIGYLCEVVAAAVEAGATTINIPDTTGYVLPGEFHDIISRLRKNVPAIGNTVLSVHCHNDLGLAVANSLSAIVAGARQIECTINGIGERAGNAALEEIVMALAVRQDKMGCLTGIDTTQIHNTSRMVSAYTGMVVQPNKAIVGANAFAHEAGIHQDGMLKSRDTYEIIRPEMVGVPKTRIVLGRHSGRHGLKSRLASLGYTPDEKELDNVYQRFIELADKKKEVFDDDLRVLMGDEARDLKQYYTLEKLQVSTGNAVIPTATVLIRAGEEVFRESCTGDGPVDAVFNAIERALQSSFAIESYHVRSITAGREALGEVQVRVNTGTHYFNGRGISTDIVEASAKALIHVFNQALSESEKENQQQVLETERSA